VIVGKEINKQSDRVLIINFRFSPEVNGEIVSHGGGGSGGYLEHVMKYAAKHILGEDIHTLKYKTLR